MHTQQIWPWLKGLFWVGILVIGWGCQPSWALSIAVPTAHQTLADRQLQIAQTLVRHQPQEADGYTQLAAANLLKSRETGDFSYALQAESALARSLEWAPNNRPALKLQLILLLTEHRFQMARDRALQLQSASTPDPQIATALIDALVELGDYPAAEAQAQNLLTTHPQARVYARVSYLKSLHGDSAGAIAMMRQAVQAASPDDREGLAWYQVHLGVELLNAGQAAAGEQAINQALQGFPDYPLALSAKAKARLRAGDVASAVELYRRSQAQIPLPDTAMALGDLYYRLGDGTAAQAQDDLVEFLVRMGGDPFRQAYAHQLVVFWSDREIHLPEALTLIQQERLTRSDVYTFDALAWCLYKLGRHAEAKTAIEQALRLGTPDARIDYHAGQIYRAAQDPVKAAQYFRQALAINPLFHPLQADIARTALAELDRA
jgi:tetratricopeptide (TPR) repeat protein